MKVTLRDIRDIFAMILLLVIYNGGAIIGWQRHIIDNLWNPYMFLGMPAFTTSGSFKYYNQIWVFWEATKHMLWANPLFTVMFFAMLYILYKKYMNFEKVVVLYVLTIFVQLTLIFTTNWSI